MFPSLAGLLQCHGTTGQQLAVVLSAARDCTGAGLPPVTAEWFEARKEQLSAALTQANNAADSVYICSLTNKRFQSEGTYETYTRTNKFKAALKKAGLKEPPAPRVVQRQARPQAAPAQHMTQLQQGMAGLVVRDDGQQAAQLAESEYSDHEEEEEGEGNSSGWETASQIDDDTLAAVRLPTTLSLSAYRAAHTP